MDEWLLKCASAKLSNMTVTIPLELAVSVIADRKEQFGLSMFGFLVLFVNWKCPTLVILQHLN
uniref:Uncharacterized protein n=1 Tax=Anguilla anguilla TaxID=7936 RepID=A0A0E9WMU9_ANGAN